MKKLLNIQTTRTEWITPDKDFRKELCVRQMQSYIRTTMLIFVLDMVLPFALIACCITSLHGNTEILKPMAIISVSMGVFAEAAFGFVMCRRLQAVKNLRFKWQCGTVDKAYGIGRPRSLVFVNTDEEYVGCYPFKSQKKYKDGDIVLVIKLIGFSCISSFVFSLNEN